ncbi:MAG: MCE family protein [Deltaproteobacteria bacterium]|nr:MCE family protein [Deltaproteobacteria bacterium]
MVDERDERSGSEGFGGDERLPEASLESRGGFSLIWLIPIVAALIGAWIAWRTYAESGPEVSISFITAEGLEAGKTEVKFKDLTVGLVQSITLAEDLSHVIVTAELTPGSKHYLTDQTQFWIVRPQISAGRATGLGTLLSGAYVGMDPALEGTPQLEFTGLESPPVITSSDRGTVFTLRSQTLGSAQINSPVYFRKISVGAVVSYEMSEDGNSVDTLVFIEAPHDKRVTSSTRFWDASGIDLTVDAEGLRLDTVSVVSLLIGGIAFDSPDGEVGDPVSEDTVFSLYPNRRASKQMAYTVKRRYLLHFSGSVQGLVPGSPVVFRGIHFGEVVDIRLQLNWEEAEVLIPVVIEIEPERFEWIDMESAAIGPQERLEHLVENGFRAQLGRGNILTGQLQVEFDFHENAPAAEVVYGGRYPELPTAPTPLEDIAVNVANIVKKVEKMPLDEIGVALRDSLAELRITLQHVSRLSAGFDKDVMPSLAATLANLESTTESVDKLMAAGAPIPIELQRAIEEIGRAAHSARLLTDYLERHPEALIRGKSNE